MLPSSLTPREFFLRGLNRQPTPRVAVGSATSIVTTDLMERVGTFFPEAHLDAECMAKLAEAGHTILGFDNVMPLFSVWHESAALGCPVDWCDRNHMPNCGEHLCNDITQRVAIPSDFLTRAPCAVPLEALRILKRRLGNDVAVLGKVFGPWTLAYHIYGIQEFLMATILDPDSVKRILANLLDVTIQFGRAQIDAGVDGLTLADHCTRDLCSPNAYSEFLTEVHQEIHDRLPCPLVLHICGDTSDRIPMIRTTGIECFHFDSAVSTAVARQLAGEQLALMGGTSNFTIVKDGTPEKIEADVAEKLRHQIDIVGPECAVPLDAPHENLVTLVAEAKKLSLVSRHGDGGGTGK